MSLAEFLEKEGVQTENQLASWLAVPGNADRLLRIHGIGKKTVDYLNILVGGRTFAIDTHIRAFLEKARVPSKDYDAAKRLLTQVAQALGVPCSILDHSIWTYMSKRRRHVSTED